MKTYTVTVIDRRRKRTRYIAIARCWYEAWETAVNTYGLRALYSVTPHNFRKPAQ